MEQVARDEGGSLLVLDTRLGDAGEGLYRSAGWIAAGAVPRCARNADGSLAGTVFFYRLP